MNKMNVLDKIVEHLEERKQICAGKEGKDSRYYTGKTDAYNEAIGIIKQESQILSKEKQISDLLPNIGDKIYVIVTHIYDDVDFVVERCEVSQLMMDKDRIAAMVSLLDHPFKYGYPRPCFKQSKVDLSIDFGNTIFFTESEAEEMAKWMSLVNNGFDKIRFISCPDGIETVCQIGDDGYWFYFDPDETENPTPSSFYMARHDYQKMVINIAGAIKNLDKEEQGYYKSVLEEP